MLTLEDTVTDVLNKAQRGLAVDDSDLISRAGISLEELLQLRAGTIRERPLLQVAPVLGLHGPSLVALAHNTWYPTIEPLAGILQFSSSFSGMLVNSYLVWDQASREAAAFDTGADAGPLLATIKDYDLFLFDCGATFTVGTLKIETRQTWGHSIGGVTYVVRGLTRTVAVVGDALFAGSIGGGRVSWADALATVRSEILGLEDEAQICPGHGPMTTVGQEKAHNTFFPEFKA
jgi:glyoxylase-like metal-dependent hydrolase (beta-lactamase superfamily II)